MARPLGLWCLRYGEAHHRDHGFASASPATDGEHIYAYFGSCGLYCYDLKGNLK